MPTTLTSTQPSLAGFDVRKSNQSDRDARRDEINRIEEEFYSAQEDLGRPEFVKINNTAYRKSELVKITFGDTLIYARFSTGDVVEISEDQLYALAS